MKDIPDKVGQFWGKKLKQLYAVDSPYKYALRLPVLISYLLILTSVQLHWLSADSTCKICHLGKQLSIIVIVHTFDISSFSCLNLYKIHEK